MFATVPVRFSAGVVSAAVVTFVLFQIMRALIFSDQAPPEDKKDNIDIQILSKLKDRDATRRDRRPEQPDDVKTPPPPPRIEASKAEQPDRLASILGALPEFQAQGVNKNDIMFAVSDRDEQPLVRGEQRYPMRALERGIEGSCVVVFDIQPDGKTANVRTSRCSSGLFEREAVRTVEGHKYAPKIVDGQPVWRYGRELELVWNMDN